MIQDPWQLKRKPRPVVTKTFRDREQDAEFTFRFQRLDTPGAAMASELAQKFIEKYMTGDDRADFPLVDGEDVELSESLFHLCVNAYMSQPRGERHYTVEDFVALSITFGAWQDVMEFIAKLNEGVSPNSSGVADAVQSFKPQLSTIAVTPSSTPGGTGSSAPSMNGSDSSAPTPERQKSQDKTSSLSTLTVS